MDCDIIDRVDTLIEKLRKEADNLQNANDLQNQEYIVNDLQYLKTEINFVLSLLGEEV